MLMTAAKAEPEPRLRAYWMGPHGPILFDRADLDEFLASADNTGPPIAPLASAQPQAANLFANFALIGERHNMSTYTSPCRSFDRPSAPFTVARFIARHAIGFTPLGLPIYPIKGAEGGYSTQGDIVTQTLDGHPLNDIWGEFQQVLDLQNRQRTALSQLLVFSTTRASDAVAQTLGDDDFEMASEFGGAMLETCG